MKELSGDGVRDDSEETEDEVDVEVRET